MRNNGQRSFHTVMIYLNDSGGKDFVGGETEFSKKYQRNGEEDGFKFVPKAGSVLVFDHDMYHEGVLVGSGKKYAIRTDLMTEPLPK